MTILAIDGLPCPMKADTPIPRRKPGSQSDKVMKQITNYFEKVSVNMNDHWELPDIFDLIYDYGTARIADIRAARRTA